MKRYWMINLTCVILSAGFLFGIIYIWRGSGEIDYEAEVLWIVGDEVNKDKETGNLKLETGESDEKLETTVVVKSVLPRQYLIDVPFTSQAPEKNWDQPWQDACEEAAVLMLDAYYKGYDLSPLFAKDEILKMIEWEKGQGWGNSLEIERVGELVGEYVFKTQNAINKTQRKVMIVEDPTVEDIKKFIANGQPVLAMADGKVLPNPHFRNGGPVYHALVIRGYTETEFITNDPGTQFGKGFRYKYDDLLDAIHDWNGGDVKNGRKAALVAEPRTTLGAGQADYDKLE